MQTQRQLRTDIVWRQRLEPSSLLKFPQNASHKITFSRDLAGFSFPVACKITGNTDFLWKHFVKTLAWSHIMQKIPWFWKFNVLRLLQCQYGTYIYTCIYIYIYIYKTYIKLMKYIYIIYSYQKRFCGWDDTRKSLTSASFSLRCLWNKA